MSAHPRYEPAIAFPGGEHGDKQFAAIGAMDLELGGYLPEVNVAFESWGRLNARADNAILVEHALTGDSHVVGEAGPGHPTTGWWPGLIGPGCPLDTDQWFIVASNVLGGCQGTTGPSSPAPGGQAWGGDFPRVTIRDQVEVEARLADQLGITRWHGILGGSMGGMRALEWAVTHPERVERVLVLASSAYATADQIAWCQAQLLAIRSDPEFRGGHYYGGPGPRTGLGIARRIAHLTYRCEGELSERFGRQAQHEEDPLGSVDGRFMVESYLDHAAAKLTRRFDANSYLVLTEAMNSHDVGRGRGDVATALGRITAKLLVAHVDTDRCYPPHLSTEIVRHVAGARGAEIRSGHGHDGFLVETDRVAHLIRAAMGDIGVMPNRRHRTG